MTKAIETSIWWAQELPDAGENRYFYDGYANHPEGGVYLTHRPGNTPEKQKAFDVVMENWIKSKRGDRGAENSLYYMALALGYGAK